MPKRRSSHIKTSNDPGQDLRDALARLKSGKPLHPQLRKLAAEGRLRINVSTVAKEANRSRTLIALEKCRYPRIRAEILALADTPTTSGRPRHDRLTADEI